jgi:hypothetical protein
MMPVGVEILVAGFLIVVNLRTKAPHYRRHRAANRNQKNTHHRDTETRRKTKSKLEGTEVAEITEEKLVGA